ncbi:CvpA family protein [Candidatus Gottesmanbacteria bacterium]|nr:CvpA family protein [Candidatus Gottesmanbacteria bacterium]
MQFNWIDWIILFVVLHQSIVGWRRGLVSVLSETIAFVVALWIAVRYHDLIGSIVVEKYAAAKEWKNVLGYILVAVPSEVIMNVLSGQLIQRLPGAILSSTINRWFGSFFSGANALLFLALTLLVILAMPVRGTLKRDIRDSIFGSTLVGIVDYYGGSVESSVETISHEAAKFVTIKPFSRDTLDLDVFPEPQQLTQDYVSEQHMVERINAERIKTGLPALRLQEDLSVVARSHSRDMLERRYFSHISPEGRDAGDRIRDHGAGYMLSGENLAYAPDVEIAHTGLMNSDAHRKNILDPVWTHIGIGVIDAEIYGKMFTQVFAR